MSPENEKDRRIRELEDELDEVNEILDEVAKQRDKLIDNTERMAEMLFLNQSPDQKAPEICLWNLTDYMKLFIGHRIKQFYESEREGVAGSFIYAQTGSYDVDEETLDELVVKWDNMLRFIWETLLEKEPDIDESDNVFHFEKYNKYNKYNKKMNRYHNRENRAIELFCKYFNDFWD